MTTVTNSYRLIPPHTTPPRYTLAYWQCGNVRGPITARASLSVEDFVALVRTEVMGATDSCTGMPIVFEGRDLVAKAKQNPSIALQSIADFGLHEDCTLSATSIYCSPFGCCGGML